MIKKQDHLTQEHLSAFHHGQLSQEDSMQVLEHVSNCNICAELFADSFTSSDTLPMPHYLKENIMEQIHHTSETEQILKSCLLEKSLINKQLFLYSIKVCAAMAGAIFITFSGLFNSNFSAVPMNFPLFSMSKISDFNKNLNQFSTKLIHSEVSYYDQEKK